MVHHALPEEAPSRSWFPRDPYARFALVSCAAAAAAVALLGVTLLGGLEPADARTGSQPPETELDSGRYKITPIGAAVAEGDFATEVQVRVDIENSDSDPIPFFDIGSTSQLTLQPGGTELTSPSLRFLRYPSRDVIDLQPHMPEEALLAWAVENPGDLDGTAEVLLTVHKAEKIQGSGGTEPLWVRGDKVVGSVLLPLGEG
ncbi:hypothetical protein NE857_00220 [Nocardiopsis exhalans]|uniref:DUF4352 domain-containing protein n=1 Tax=Nocardiopsis exhalans TaxID=163604 RepID=A0ABY5D702_9ACTN|nr:hypothetical protein [Nocardiopsis exhalans]USY20147.1 hypothetical protein NE857_00220 [Nocardiopsis exhalans]